MYSFVNDYSEGCHPSIMAKLQETNMEQTTGYGFDPHCDNARKLIRKACNRPDAAVHFFVGGTQTNLTIIGSMLRPHQAVYGAVPSHINTHEAGAIERTGHKVIALPSKNGKLTAEQVEEAQLEYLQDPSREHLAQPKMVYISQPTEIGTLYYKHELEDLYGTCQRYGLYLFIDGARMGYGLAADGNDVKLSDLAMFCDIFYIGGTKCGALLGEAAVILNPALKEDFFTIMKGAGAILAKGRIIGIQFETLFTDNLYIDICRHAINMAMLIRDAIWAKNLHVLTESATNQQFPIMPRALYEKIAAKYEIALWANLPDDMVVCRICTSWATDEKIVHQFIQDFLAM